MLDEQGSENQNTGTGETISRPQPLSKGQKIAVVLLAFFAFLLVIGWTFQLKRAFSEPSMIVDDGARQASVQTEDYCLGDTCYTGEESMQRAADTDKDGLNDYDELNVYKTSPYLEDSDSDGHNDKMEIDSGNDPNCAIGRDCANSIIPPTETAPSLNEELLSGFDLNSPDIGSGGQSQEAIDKVMSGVSSAAELRQMLLGAGMDKEILDKISDADLLKSYESVLEGQK